jgi:hypothetical protein
MNYEIKRKRYKKHIMEIEFLRAELAYQEEILTTAHQDFEIWHREWCSNNNINLDELNQKHKTQVSKIISQPNFPDFKHDEKGILVLNDKINQKEKKSFSKLYKRVAIATHPDKHEGNALDFKAASAAYELGDWSLLIQIAEKYNIFPDDIDELIPLLEEDATNIKKNIEKNKTMYSWKFRECKTEECKENLIKNFLKHLFNLEL